MVDGLEYRMILSFVLLTACGDDPGSSSDSPESSGDGMVSAGSFATETSTSATENGESSSSADTSAAGSSSDTTGDGDNPFVPPEVSAACEAPEVAIAATWSTAKGQRIDALRLAYGGT